MPSQDEWQREMDRYLEHFLRAGKRPSVTFTQHTRATPSWTPPVDVYETDGSLVVVLDLAGLSSSELEVNAEPGRLVVRGARASRSVAAEQEARTYHVLEIPYGQFERVIQLPPGLDTDETEAAYRDGLLHITLPKRAPRQVRVRVTDGGEVQQHA